MRGRSERERGESREREWGVRWRSKSGGRE